MTDEERRFVEQLAQTVMRQEGEIRALAGACMLQSKTIALLAARLKSLEDEVEYVEVTNDAVPVTFGPLVKH